MKLPLSFTTAKSSPSPLQPRQSSGGGGDCGCMDGGTIAGIIIGSVAGILLLIWLIRTTCFLNRTGKTGDTDGHETRRTVYDNGGSRGRRRGSKGSSYVSYRTDKPGGSRGSRRYRDRDLQRPAKVYAV